MSRSRYLFTFECRTGPLIHLYTYTYTLYNCIRVVLSVVAVVILDRGYRYYFTGVRRGRRKSLWGSPSPTSFPNKWIKKKNEFYSNIYIYIYTYNMYVRVKSHFLGSSWHTDFFPSSYFFSLRVILRVFSGGTDYRLSALLPDITPAYPARMCTARNIPGGFYSFLFHVHRTPVALSPDDFFRQTLFIRNNIVGSCRTRAKEVFAYFQAYTVRTSHAQIYVQ